MSESAEGSPPFLSSSLSPSLPPLLPPSLGRRIALFAVAAIFIFAGIAHFMNADFFIAIVPPYLPAAAALVYVSGVFEILGGVGVLHPRFRRLAGYGLLALLVAVYPANIHMAMYPELFPDVTRAMAYGRLPLQFVLAGVVWWAIKPTHSTTHPTTHSTMHSER